jgi:hypothetical protein
MGEKGSLIVVVVVVSAGCSNLRMLHLNTRMSDSLSALGDGSELDYIPTKMGLFISPGKWQNDAELHWRYLPVCLV